MIPFLKMTPRRPGPEKIGWKVLVLDVIGCVVISILILLVLLW